MEDFKNALADIDELKDMYKLVPQNRVESLLWEKKARELEFQEDHLNNCIIEDCEICSSCDEFY